MTTFYLAICHGCDPDWPQPFYDEAERDRWADAHAEATGHTVDRQVEVRL